MTVLSVRRVAHDLDAALVSGAIPTDPALAQLSRLADRLCSMAAGLEPAALPSPEFRSALRTRLVAVASVTPQTTTGSVRRPAATSWAGRPAVQRRLGVAAAGLASVVAVTGVGVAASQSLPGQAFYGLKTGYEDLQLELSSGDIAKGTRHLDFAATRLQEVRALAAGKSLAVGASGPVLTAGSVGSATRIAQTLGVMDAEASAGQRLLEQSWRDTGAREPLQLLAAFATRQSAVLRPLLPQLPLSAQTAARASLALLGTMEGQSTQLLGAPCAGACGVRGTSGKNGTPALTHSSSGAPCSCSSGPGAPALPGRNVPSAVAGTPAPAPAPPAVKNGPAPAGPLPPGPTPAPGGPGATLVPTLPPLPGLGGTTPAPRVSPPPLPLLLPTAVPTLPLP